MEPIFSFLLTVGVVIGLIFVIVLLCSSGNASDKRKNLPSPFESPQKQAGRKGERDAAALISRICGRGDRVFRNVNVCFDEKPTELDMVIVNQFGVFVLEVKNWVGNLEGDVDDYTWRKNKMDAYGNIFDKEEKNPIRQVNREVYLFSKCLKSHGIPAWVEGYVFLINQNPHTAQSDKLLADEWEVNRVIHAPTKRPPTPADQEKICSLISAALNTGRALTPAEAPKSA